MARSLHELPKHGTTAPWRVAMDPREDEKLLRRDPIDDGVLRLSARPAAAPAAPARPVAA